MPCSEAPAPDFLQSTPGTRPRRRGIAKHRGLTVGTNPFLIPDERPAGRASRHGGIDRLGHLAGKDAPQGQVTESSPNPATSYWAWQLGQATSFMTVGSGRAWPSRVYRRIGRILEGWDGGPSIPMTRTLHRLESARSGLLRDRKQWRA